jgi:L-ascorbate metabolism protein UlaG (beta-lactamase superfamily)
LIGQQYGPFDLAMMECGQYGRNWIHAHMFPTQTAQAAADLKAKMIIPVHWAKFAESNHPWNEPVKLMMNSADSLHIQVCVPKIGEPYTIGEPPRLIKWWEIN